MPTLNLDSWISRLLRHRAALALPACIVLVASGGHARTVAYVSNADSRDIYVLSLDESNGTVAVLDKAPAEGAVMPMAVSPDRKYLYAALRSDGNKVRSFAIDPASGGLRPLELVPLPDNMAYISTDRTGKYLFGASYSGNKVSVNSLGQNGVIDAKPQAVIPSGKNAHCIIVDPSNKFLFVPSLGDDAILQYRFDAATGEVTPNTPPSIHTKKGAGPRHLVFSPNGRFAFGTNELDGTVNAYQLDADGLLTLLQTVSVVPPDFKGPAPSTADLHLTPDGKFLYASERTSNTLAAFRVDAETAKLTAIGNYPTETQPRGFNVDPQGKYLLAAGQKSGGLSIYEIDPQTGTLRKLSHLDLGKNPNWVEIITLADQEPSGN